MYQSPGTVINENGCSKRLPHVAAGAPYLALQPCQPSGQFIPTLTSWSGTKATMCLLQEAW